MALRTFFIFLLAIGLALPGLCAPNSAITYQLDETLVVKKVNPGVYVVTHSYPWPSNSLVVAMNDSEILLVDTPYTPEATEKLLGWIDRSFGRRKITAINTHYHIDRLGGNAALLARKIPIYGSDHTASLLKERGESTKQLMMGWITDEEIKERYSRLQFAAPDHIFPENAGLRLRFGRETVEVFYPGPGHTPDNLVVYCPAKKLLFGGCMIVSGPKLGNVMEADLAEWAKSMDKLSRFDAKIVIPGHGGEDAGYSPSLINHTRELLDKAVNQSK